MRQAVPCADAGWIRRQNGVSYGPCELVRLQMTKARKFTGRLVLSLVAFVFVQTALGADWSNTELQLQYGTLDVPAFAGGGDSVHLIYTLQHASGWKYGDNFFVFDVIDARDRGFQDFDIYGEWYGNLSLGKLLDKEVGSGPVTDIGLIVGLNWAADANVRKYAAGIRLALDLSKFSFANLDIMAYVDDSEGVASSGAPREDNTFLIDFNFARPFQIGSAKFSIEGHVEYVGERDNELGGKSKWWILAQPQIRWHTCERIALGIEYQFWTNKLGDPTTDESAVQALFVLKF